MLKSSKKNLFVCFTPYHILTALGIANKINQSQENYIIIVNDFQDGINYVKKLKNWKERKFKGIFLIKGRHDFKSHSLAYNIYLLTQKKKSCKKIWEEYFSKYSNTLYIFNDNTIEGQFLAKKNFKLGGKNYFVEDGLIVYNPIPNTQALKTKLINISMMLLLRMEYNRCLNLGTNRYITNIFTFYPEYAKPELKDKTIEKIPSKIFLELKETSFYPVLENIYSFNLDDYKMDILVILPDIYELKYYNKTLDECKNIFASILDIFEKNHKRTLFKYHPLSHDKDFLDLRVHKNPEFSFAQKSIPAELIFLSNLKQENIIILGTFSAALYLARVILGNSAKIISIGKLFEPVHMDNKVNAFFEKLGIEMVNSLSELNGSIQ